MSANSFDMESYLVNGLHKAFKPKPKYQPYVDTGGREFHRRNNNTFTIREAMKAAFKDKKDVDAYVALVRGARRA